MQVSYCLVPLSCEDMLFLHVSGIFSLSTVPAGLTAFNVAPTSFSVQWENVPCIQRNGDITGYSVRYGVLGNGGMETLTMVGCDILMTNLTGLVPDTSYLVQVAGVNGHGGWSVWRKITVTTPQS